MPALAITDDGNMFGVLEFYKECRQAGIQPIIGCDFFLAPESRHNKSAKDQHPARLARLPVLAYNQTGYRNLIQLASLAYLEGFYYRPRIDKELLERFHEGLIGLSGSLSGEVPGLLLRNRRAEATEAARRYRDIFGAENFYLALHNHGIPDEHVLNQALIELSGELDIPLVAANESYYVLAEDAAAHDVLLCIGNDRKKHEQNRFRFSSTEFYLKTPEEMESAFGDIPHAIANTMRIAQRCNLEIELPGPQFPDYEIPEGFSSPDEYMRHITLEGIKERYPEVTEEIRSRTEYELSTIIGMGYTGYFLIVWDFIAYARSCDIPVGPGRGSGAGSIVAYALKITDIEPLRYGLLFERFLNPDRVSMPDFDIDFCYERRGEVIQYVTQKYGEDRVGQIITFGTLKAKAVIRDVARALDFSFQETNEIAKLIPKDLKMTLPKALEQEPKLREIHEAGGRNQELIDTALKLENLHRHPSTHAAGIVIGKKPLTEYVPLFKDPKTGMISTQFTMEQIEDCGLVKMDFLGLKTLTLIRNTEKLIRRRGIAFDIETVSEQDPATFRMLGEGDSSCVFQFESQGMRGILSRAKPERIEDLIALNALYRPGPMQNIDQFVDSKNGRMPISYPLPQLEPILKETYGVIVYQEQVMQIVQVVAGFSLGEADILRRAMGKKKEAEMGRMKAKFLEGAAAKGIDPKKAESIFELLVPFAGYGFNKSHAAAYSVLAYKTAYLKANFPAEFMAANLTNEMNSPDKFAEYLSDTKKMGLAVLPPDINTSDKYFTVHEGQVRYGLLGIKNVGAAAVDEILLVRGSEGPFVSFGSFLERINLKTVNRKVIETCIQCGVFDSLGVSRAVLLHNSQTFIDHAVAQKASTAFGQTSLFDGESGEELAGPHIEEVEDWDLETRLGYEREHLGFYCSGHPLDGRKELWFERSTINLAKLPPPGGDTVYALIGLVSEPRVLSTKNGKQLAFTTIEDYNGSIEIVLFSEVFEKYQDRLVGEQVLGVLGKLEQRGERLQIVVEEIRDPEELDERDIGTVHIRIHEDFLSEEELYNLRAFLHERRGSCPVWLHIGSNGEETVVRASQQLTVSSRDEVLKQIKQYPGVAEIWQRKPEYNGSDTPDQI